MVLASLGSEKTEGRELRRCLDLLVVTVSASEEESEEL